MATYQQRGVVFLPGVRLTLKSLRIKDYSKDPQSLGEHLKNRRRELGLFQREAAGRLGCDVFSYINWEKDRTRPVASRFRPIISFLGYDPTPEPQTLAGRVNAKRRTLGVTFEQVAQHLGWDPGTLSRYQNGTRRLSARRTQALERFLAPRAEDAVSVSAIGRPAGGRGRLDV